MKSPRPWLALGWTLIAIAIRTSGLGGGDAAIVSGLVFLGWTLPFGVIWQFWLYEHALTMFSVNAAQLLGDALTIVTFLLFWFVFVPFIARRARGDG